MSTVTAQFLVGRAHQNHGGIEPTHYLFLTENSKPAWFIFTTDVFSEEKHKTKKITWIPTVDNMLEDALLMIAIHILKDKEICELAKKYFRNKSAEWVEMYEDIDEKDRHQLYEKCRDIKIRFKIVLTALEGSSILNQIKILENYKMDMEIFTPQYIRSFSDWTGETRIEGAFERKLIE